MTILSQETEQAAENQRNEWGERARPSEAGLPLRVSAGAEKDFRPAFLQAYLRRAQGASFLPPATEERAILLDSFLLETMIHELGSELTNRREWLRIPLQGIRQILGE